MDASDAKVPRPTGSSPDLETSAPDLTPTPAVLPPTLKFATNCFTVAPTICSTNGLGHEDAAQSSATTIPNTMPGLPPSTTPMHAPEFVVPVTTSPSSPTVGTTCGNLDIVGVHVTEMSLRLKEMFRATRVIAVISSTQSVKLFVNGKLQTSTPIWCSPICIDDMDMLMPAFKLSMTSTIEQKRQILRPMPWPSSFLNDQVAHSQAPYHSGSTLAETDEAEHIGKPFLCPRPDSKLEILQGTWLLIERIWGWSPYLFGSVKISTDKQDVPCNIVCLRFQQSGVFATHPTDGIFICSRHYTTVIRDTWYKSGSYSSDNMIIGGKEVLITRLLTNMFCCNTTKSEVIQSHFWPTQHIIGNSLQIYGHCCFAQMPVMGSLKLRRCRK